MTTATEIYKIEAPILTMKLVTTLITDIEITSTMDVSRENDAYNIGKQKLPQNIRIAAGSWLLSSDSHYNARLSVLTYVFNLVIGKLPKLTFWYLVGNSAWQEDTRIIRHKGLWRGLYSRGVDVTHYSDSREEMILLNGKVKFFGAKLISELSIQSVVKALTKEHCSYLIAVPEGTDVNDILRFGWEVFDGFDKNILQYVIENSGLIFKPVGGFDDPQSGFVGLGDPELVRNIV